MIKHISNSSLNLRKFLNKKSTIYISRPFILVEKHKKKSKDIDCLSLILHCKEKLEEEIFSVDTVDDRGNRIIFYMHRKNNSWTIIPQPLPDWIAENEDKLNEQIDAEFKV